MAAVIAAELVEQIKSLLGLMALEIIVRPSWGSNHSGYRDEIHGELKKRMAKAYPFSDSSISHCRSMGGFAFTTYDSDHVIGLGFDIEEDSRVSQEIARRVCKTNEEYLRAPSTCSLWAAKEAAFKSLKGPKQPLTVSDLEIEDWKQADSQIEMAQVKNPKVFGSSRIHGVLLKKPPHTYSFFVALP